MILNKINYYLSFFSVFFSHEEAPPPWTRSVPAFQVEPNNHLTKKKFKKNWPVCIKVWSKDDLAAAFHTFYPEMTTHLCRWKKAGGGFEWTDLGSERKKRFRFFKNPNISWIWFNSESHFNSLTSREFVHETKRKTWHTKTTTTSTNVREKKTSPQQKQNTSVRSTKRDTFPSKRPLRDGRLPLIVFAQVNF